MLNYCAKYVIEYNDVLNMCQTPPRLQLRDHLTAACLMCVRLET